VIVDAQAAVDAAADGKRKQAKPTVGEAGSDTAADAKARDAKLDVAHE
jgi:hypothetical protein